MWHTPCLQIAEGIAISAFQPMNPRVEKKALTKVPSPL
jgi:hypothetical protein